MNRITQRQTTRHRTKEPSKKKAKEKVQEMYKDVATKTFAHRNPIKPQTGSHNIVQRT